MFSGCSSLTSIPKHLSIPNSVTNCSQMFADCSNLIEVEAGFTLGNSLVDCSSMFSYCSNLTTIPPSMKLPNCIQTCQNMFYYDFSQLSSDISYIWPDEFEYTGTIDLNSLMNLLIIVVVLYVVSALFSYLQSYFIIELSTKISFDLRERIMDKILYLIILLR